MMLGSHRAGMLKIGKHAGLGCKPALGKSRKNGHMGYRVWVLVGVALCKEF